MKIKTALLTALIVLPSIAQASFLDSKDFESLESNNYWSNFDLGLDFMRLSWADTLGDPDSSQKSLEDYNTFVDGDAGWRFATVSEFDQYTNWFDSDTTTNGWSLAQNPGSNLFFELNGYGPGFTQQNGFDHEGYTYWQFVTLSADTTEQNEYLSTSWIADFGDQDETVVCVDWSVLCNAAYFPDEGSPVFSAIEALFMSYSADHPFHANNPFNVAPLLVRDIATFSTVEPPVEASGPAVWSITLSSLFFLVLRLKRK